MHSESGPNFKGLFMLVGVLSDSHGDAEMTGRAVELLLGRGAKRLFHCGDICGEGVLDALARHDCTLVWGNCDSSIALMERYARRIGLNPMRPAGAVTVAGKSIGLFHGHEREFEDALERGGLDYVFHGHTHRYRDSRINGCRVIN